MLTHAKKECRWERFSHQADVGVRGVSPTLEGAFEGAAVALTSVVTDPSEVAPTEVVSIACEAPSLEILLVDWLNAVIYEMATRRMLFGMFDVRISGTRLEARAWGEPVDVARHEPAIEVKGATFTGLQVRREQGGAWVAQCIVDV